MPRNAGSPLTHTISMKYRILVLAITLAVAGCSNSDNDSIPIETPINDPGENQPGGPVENPVGTPTNTPTGTPADTPAGTPTDTPTGTPTGTPVALENVGQDLLVSLAGFQADRLSLSVRELAARIAAAGEAMPQPASTFETLDGFGPEIVVSPSQVTAYTCNAGGQMTHETGRLRDGVGTELSLLGDYDAFTFDACRHSEDGDYELNGGLVMGASSYTVSRGNRLSHSSSWSGFSMTVPGDIVYEITGNVAASDFSAANFGSGDTRTVDLPNYKKTLSGQTTVSLDNASLSLTRAIPNGSNDSRYELDADGVVVDPSTEGFAVTINTDPVLSGRQDLAQGIEEPFSGQITMSSADGSELILSANPASQISVMPGDLLVDLVIMQPGGESNASDAIPLIDITSGNVDRRCFVEGTSDADCGSAQLP